MGITNSSLPRQINDEYYTEIRWLIEKFYDIDSESLEIDMGDSAIMFDSVCGNREYRKIMELLERMRKFIFTWQYVLQKKFPSIMYYYENYETSSTILTQKWIEWAVDYDKSIIPTILKVFTYLEYNYQYEKIFKMSMVYNYPYEEKGYKYVSDYDKSSFTLEQILGNMVMYENGIYNSSLKIRNWGLYESSLYHVGMYHVMHEIIEILENKLE